jgi:predicted ATPase
VQLLERESQLTALQEYAEEARAGAGRMVLISGEAGIGKSSLIEASERRLPDARWGVGCL